MADISKKFTCRSTVKKITDRLVDAGVNFNAVCEGDDVWKITVKGEHIKLLSVSRLESVVSSIGSLVARSTTGKR